MHIFWGLSPSTLSPASACFSGCTVDDVLVCEGVKARIPGHRSTPWVIWRPSSPWLLHQECQVPSPGVQVYSIFQSLAQGCHLCQEAFADPNTHPAACLNCSPHFGGKNYFVPARERQCSRMVRAMAWKQIDLGANPSCMTWGRQCNFSEL